MLNANAATNATDAVIGEYTILLMSTFSLRCNLIAKR